MSGRIFLIGSGPSLKETDLNKLQKSGDDVMVMNKFGMIADALGFTIKPMYYFKIDHNTVDQTHIQEIQWGHANCSHLFLWDRFKTGFPPIIRNTNK